MFTLGLIFFSSFFIVFRYTPAIVQRIELITKTLINPKREDNKAKISRFGGTALIFAYLISILLWITFSSNNANYLINFNNLSIALSASFLIFLLGLFDDFLNLSPFLRLFFQILISIIVWSQGIAIDLNNLNLGFFLNNNNELLSLLITSFWIVGITNAINWMDGLDGLASGFTFLAALGFLIVGFISGNDINIIIISSAISGLALGFLKHNFRPAKLYMGDGGSYLLGFNLALLSLLINNHQNLSTKFSPLLIMFIPIFDMCVVIINRIKNGHSPFFPDKSHLHHRIMNYGFDEKKTVFTIYFLSLISISTAVFINL